MKKPPPLFPGVLNAEIPLDPRDDLIRPDREAIRQRIFAHTLPLLKLAQERLDTTGAAIWHPDLMRLQRLLTSPLDDAALVEIGMLIERLRNAEIHFDQVAAPTKRGRLRGAARAAEAARIREILRGYEAEGIPRKAMPAKLLDEHNIRRSYSAVCAILGAKA